jgi:hypothetical protein
MFNQKQPISKSTFSAISAESRERRKHPSNGAFRRYARSLGLVLLMPLSHDPRAALDSMARASRFRLRGPLCVVYPFSLILKRYAQRRR